MVSIKSGPGTPKATALRAYSLSKWGEYFGWMAPWDLNPEWHFHNYIFSGSKHTHEQGGILWLDSSLGFEPRVAYSRTKVVRLQAGTVVKPTVLRLCVLPWHSPYN